MGSSYRKTGGKPDGMRFRRGKGRETMLRNCLSKVRWIALASVVAIGAAGSAWATPAVYDLSFSCAGLGCGTASPSLALTVNGSSVSFTGSIFGQTLTTGSFLVTPTSPTLVTGTAGTATGSALTLGGSHRIHFRQLVLPWKRGRDLVRNREGWNCQRDIQDCSPGDPRAWRGPSLRGWPIRCGAKSSRYRLGPRLATAYRKARTLWSELRFGRGSLSDSETASRSQDVRRSFLQEE
jgi:hypothetical protein